MKMTKKKSLAFCAAVCLVLLIPFSLWFPNYRLIKRAEARGWTYHAKHRVWVTSEKWVVGPHHELSWLLDNWQDPTSRTTK